MNATCLPRLLALATRVAVAQSKNGSAKREIADLVAMLDVLGYDTATIMREAMRMTREELSKDTPPEWLREYHDISRRLAATKVAP